MAIDEETWATGSGAWDDGDEDPGEDGDRDDDEDDDDDYGAEEPDERRRA